ncbi:MAG: PrgI family protein [Patescibacteria group bacterium]
MQFEVPQFIEIEDKIFGPLTFKQFAYLAGGAGLSFIFYTLIPFPFSVLFVIPIAVLSLALAFYKVHGKPFVAVLESAIRFTLSNRLYVWKRKEASSEKKDAPPEKAAESALSVPRLSDSKLKDLAWGLDVHKNVR